MQSVDCDGPNARTIGKRLLVPDRVPEKVLEKL